MGRFLRYAGMIFAPVQRLMSRGPHEPALRRKPATCGKRQRLRHALPAVSDFIEEFEFVWHKWR
jgi:hypothetical protein